MTSPYPQLDPEILLPFPVDPPCTAPEPKRTKSSRSKTTEPAANCGESHEDPPEGMRNAQEWSLRPFTIMPGSHVGLRLLVPFTALHKVDRRSREAKCQRKVDSKNPKHGNGLVKDSADDLQDFEGLTQFYQSK